MRAYKDFFSAWNSGDESSGELNLVVCVFEVEDWHGVIDSVGNESFHVGVDVNGTEVASGFDKSEVVLLLFAKLLSHYSCKQGL